MIEILLVGIWVVLFVGMFLAGYFAVRERERERAPRPAPQPELEHGPTFFVRPLQARTLEDLVVRQIEHHLREERMVADRFVDAPSALTLWAGHSLSADAAN